jgi:phospholipid-binding lipoprotein MlaA
VKISLKKSLLIIAIILTLNTQCSALDNDLPDDIELDTSEAIKINDKFEKTNRKVFQFNKGTDKVVIDPATEAYKYVTFSQLARQSIDNALKNLYEPNHMINSIFYLNPAGFFRSGVRFLINSTIGLAGLFDVATKLGVQRYDIGFSDIMAGRMCIKNGPYLMLPILGPSTVRNGSGLLIDKLLLDPFSFIFPFWGTAARFGIELISTKEQMKPLMQQISQDSIDPYTTLKSYYYQSDYVKEFTTYDHSKK